MLRGSTRDGQLRLGRPARAEQPEGAGRVRAPGGVTAGRRRERALVPLLRPLSTPAAAPRTAEPSHRNRAVSSGLGSSRPPAPVRPVPSRTALRAVRSGRWSASMWRRACTPLSGLSTSAGCGRVRPAGHQREAPAGGDGLGGHRELVDAVRETESASRGGGDGVDGRHDREAVVRRDPRLVGHIARGEPPLDGQRVVGGHRHVERSRAAGWWPSPCAASPRRGRGGGRARGRTPWSAAGSRPASHPRPRATAVARRARRAPRAAAGRTPQPRCGRPPPTPLRPAGRRTPRRCAGPAPAPSPPRSPPRPAPARRR